MLSREMPKQLLDEQLSEPESRPFFFSFTPPETPLGCLPRNSLGFYCTPILSRSHVRPRNDVTWTPRIGTDWTEPQKDKFKGADLELGDVEGDDRGTMWSF